MATPTDANGNNEVPQEVEITIPNSDALDAIAEQYEAAQGVKEVEPEQQVQQVQQNTQANEQIEAVGLVDDPAKLKVKVKLDGQEAELPLTEVLAGYQKNEVASRRLNEATRLKQEAEALMQQAQSANQGKEEQQQPSGDALTMAKEVISNLLDGNEEGAAQTLAKVIEGRGNSTQTLDPTEIATAVKQQLDVDSALDAFSRDYADILSDPHLANLTNQRLAQEIQSGVHQDQASALKAAGDGMRDWLKSLGVQSQQNNNSTTPNERVDRKQAVEQLPVLSKSAGSQQDLDESPEDIIKQMKAERGLIA